MTCAGGGGGGAGGLAPPDAPSINDTIRMDVMATMTTADRASGPRRSSM